MNPAILGDRLLRYRKAHGLTLEKLGELAATNSSRLCQYEGGQLPTLPVLARLANALGVTANDLLEDANE